MTYERREEIFSKDILNIKDLMDLMDLPYQQAAALMREIKRKHDRLNVLGKIHVQDYLDHFKLDGGERYGKKNHMREEAG